MKDCSARVIYLNNSQISKADDLIGYEFRREIYVKNTPLSQNPDELQKLIDAYPRTEIIY